MNPAESKIFLKFLAGAALGWILIALAAWGADVSARNAFFSAFQMVFLDLVFLILLFWQLFFGSRAGPVWKIRVFMFFTFKLVCLAFLAITLKRLRNDPNLPVAFAVLFMGVGPLVAAAFARSWIKSKQG